MAKKGINIDGLDKEQKKVLNNLPPLKVGIIYNQTNKDDLIHYKNTLNRIKNSLGDKIKFIVLGYDGSKGKDDFLKGIDLTYVKTVSIGHYFKQLKSLELDLLFIPLIKNIYNVTSENYNKYLEAGILGIPVLTISIYPYNTLIQDKRNGFLFKEEHEIVPYFEHLNKERGLIRLVGDTVKDIIETHYNFSQKNIEVIGELFQKNQEL